MGKARLLWKSFCFTISQRLKGLRAGQDYDQMNIYPVTSWLLSQEHIGVTSLWTLTAFDWEKQGEEGLWFPYIPAGGQCKRQWWNSLLEFSGLFTAHVVQHHSMCGWEYDTRPLWCSGVIEKCVQMFYFAWALEEFLI